MDDGFRVVFELAYQSLCKAIDCGDQTDRRRFDLACIETIPLLTRGTHAHCPYAEDHAKVIAYERTRCMDRTNPSLRWFDWGVPRALNLFEVTVSNDFNSVGHDLLNVVQNCVVLNRGKMCLSRKKLNELLERDDSPISKVPMCRVHTFAMCMQSMANLATLRSPSTYFRTCQHNRCRRRFFCGDCSDERVVADGIASFEELTCARISPTESMYWNTLLKIHQEGPFDNMPCQRFCSDECYFQWTIAMHELTKDISMREEYVNDVDKTRHSLLSPSVQSVRRNRICRSLHGCIRRNVSVRKQFKVGTAMPAKIACRMHPSIRAKDVLRAICTIRDLLNLDTLLVLSTQHLLATGLLHQSLHKFTLPGERASWRHPKFMRGYVNHALYIGSILLKHPTSTFVTSLVSIPTAVSIIRTVPMFVK